MMCARIIVGVQKTKGFPTQSEPVSAVIVTHNSGKHLFSCLESIFGSEYPLKELIVVDNASNDGSIHEVTERFPGVKIFLNQGNIGYARAANIGMRASSGKFIVLVNPDTIVEKIWLRELVEAAKRHPKSAFFQPKIMLLNKPSCFNSAGNMIHVAGFGICRGLGEPDRGQYEMEENVAFASGACVLARCDALREIGMCDELFFMYMDDLDWGWRGKMLGWESTYVPSSVIYHKWGEPLSRNEEKFYYLESGRIIALTKNLRSRSILVLSPILIICEVAVLVTAMFNRWYPAKIRSYSYVLRVLRAIIGRRKKLAQQRRVLDAVILRSFVTELTHPYIGAGGLVLSKICGILFSFLRYLL